VGGTQVTSIFRAKKQGGAGGGDKIFKTKKCGVRKKIKSKKKKPDGEQKDKKGRGEKDWKAHSPTI